MEFLDAEYIPSTGSGRKAEPNPYTDIIAQIALKKDEKGKPVAKAIVLDYDVTVEGAESKVVEAHKRKLAAAGAGNDPQVSVSSKPTPYVTKRTKANPDGEIVPGKVLLNFWTVPKQNRPRKAKTA